MGPHARGEALPSPPPARHQHQDTGAKMVHMAPHTSSHIVSKSIARHGGRSAYRGLVQIMKNARHSKSNVLCDALLVDEISRSDTYPYVDVRTDDVEMGHEATVSKVSADQLFYLMQRGLTETEAMATIVRGFVEPSPGSCPWSTPSSSTGSSSCRWRTRWARDAAPHRLSEHRQLFETHLITPAVTGQGAPPHA